MGMMKRRIQKFEKILGYTFNNKGLLIEALSHSSYVNESRRKKRCNERLEFLGDSVLSIVVSEYLFIHFKHLPEGELTKIRSTLVCEKSLYEFAKEIKLGDFILLGRGERITGGRDRSSILGDAFEAVIAAIYMDGGLEAARKHIMRFMPKDIDTKRKTPGFNHDYKTILQEVVQKNEETVTYELVEASGPDHHKAFNVEVRLNSNVIGRGSAENKKEAEQLAAKEALELMGYDT